MEKLLIQGLQDEGPGDIVGAITSKVGIPPEEIGDIEIKQSHAEVDVYQEVADEIVKKMNNNTIGNSEVQIDYFNKQDLYVTDKFEDLDDYIDTYTHLVELEREQEMEEHTREMKNLSGKQREEKGRAILHLDGKDKGEGLGGYLVKFVRNFKGEELPKHEISVGDLVMLSKQDPLREDNPTGTVAEKTKYSITVSFDGKPQGFVFSQDLRMDLYVNDITFQRMKEALASLEEADEDLIKLREILINKKDPNVKEANELDYLHNSQLNESQQQAVEKSLVANNFYLIHGPPGTGKTTTTIEVIQQCVDRGQKVLATADSNTAIDNMLEFLLEQDTEAVRVGHPARVTPQLREYSLDNLVKDNNSYKKSKELREKAFDLKDKQEDLTYPSGKYRRGMSNEQIKELAKKGKGSRGVSSKKIKEMAKSIELKQEIDDLFERSRELEDQAIGEVLKNMDVVCSTNSTSGSELLKNQTFDVVVIDEATQATEPSCLIPLTKANKVIMAGDHKQLPPTIKSEEAADKGLEQTMFERLAYNYEDKIKSMLTIQYRMHEDIMNFSNEQFYKEKVVADESVKFHTLKDLDFDNKEVEASFRQITNPDEPLAFINITGSEIKEETDKDSNSKYNKKEAEIALRLANNFQQGGVKPEDIAIISPYKAQTDKIDSKINQEELEVDTVDGFQGREKEVVIISLVRSNPDNEIGFLNEIRRMNVAITRAKRKLVVIGDEVTLNTNPFYQDFIEYVSKNGFHYTLIE